MKLEAGQVPAAGLGVEGVEQGPGEGVADDHQHRDAVVVARLPQRLGVERAPGQRHHAPAEGQLGERHDVAGAVHQRSRGQHDRRRPRRAGEELAVGRDRRAVAQRERGRLGRQPHERVLLPHHALGQAGRAPGVQEPPVAARPTPRPHDRALGRRRRGGVGVDRPVGTRLAAVVDPQPQPHLRQPVADALDGRRERAVEHDGRGVGVVPQVDELVVAVAVVGVDRHHRRLEAGEDAPHVGRVVGEVLRHLVLVAQPGVEQRARQSVRPTVELGPAHRARTVDGGRRVAAQLGADLPEVREVPPRHGVPSSWPSWVDPHDRRARDRP